MRGPSRSHLMLMCVVLVISWSETTHAGIEIVQSSGAPLETVMSPSTQNPYLVSGLAVDMRADNAVMAREKAFGEALQQGFMRLLEQVVPDALARASIATPPTAEISGMLQDFSTTNEQLSATRYTATYELRFKPARVQAFLGGASSFVSSGQPDETGRRLIPPKPETPTLILPFYQANAQPVLWASSNPLRDALQQQSADDVSMKFALGDLEDVQIFDEANGLSYAPEQMQALLRKYGVGQALIAVAVPDHGGGTGVTVMFYRADQITVQPTYIDTLSVVAANGEAPVSVYARIASQIRAQTVDLITRPVRMQAMAPAVNRQYMSGMDESAATLSPIQIRARFQSLMEWQQIRARLTAMPGVQGLRVLRLKTQEARLELVYAGVEAGLLAQLQGNGLSTALLSSGSDGIDPAAGNVPVNGSTSPAIYDVSLSPGAGQPATLATDLPQQSMTGM